MKKIKTSKNLAYLLQYPIKIISSGLNNVHETQFQSYLRRIHGITKLPTVTITGLLGNIDEQVDSYSFSTGTSLITDIVLLKGMASKLHPCQYLEIGSWRGESLVNVASNAKQCTAITLSKDDMRNMHYHEHVIDQHLIYVSNQPNIQVIEANSQEFDFNSLNQTFDLIFIDGDHSYQGVLNDTRKVFNLLKNEDSVLVWHDYSSNTDDVRHSVLAAILDGLPEAEHKHLYHVSNTMCAIYSRKSLNARIMEYRELPDNKFRVNIVSFSN